MSCNSQVPRCPQNTCEWPLWGALCSHACEEKVLGGKQIGAPAASAPVRCICFSTMEMCTEPILEKNRTGHQTVRNWCPLILLIELTEKRGAPGTEGPCPQIVPCPRSWGSQGQALPTCGRLLSFPLRPPRAVGSSLLHQCRWEPVGSTPCASSVAGPPAWPPEGSQGPCGWLAAT